MVNSEDDFFDGEVGSVIISGLALVIVAKVKSNGRFFGLGIRQLRIQYTLVN